LSAALSGRGRLTCEKLGTAAAAHSGEQGLAKACAMMLVACGGCDVRREDAFFFAEEFSVVPQCDVASMI
jgi:hypothetical protein